MPEDLSNLRRLETLDLSMNSLQHPIPVKAAIKLSSLRVLHLRSNPIASLPYELLFLRTTELKLSVSSLHTNQQPADFLEFNNSVWTLTDICLTRVTEEERLRVSRGCDGEGIFPLATTRILPLDLQERLQEGQICAGCSKRFYGPPKASGVLTLTHDEVKILLDARFCSKYCGCQRDYVVSKLLRIN